MELESVNKLYNGEAISREEVKQELTTIMKDNAMYNVATQMVIEQVLVQADVIQMATNDIAINCGLTMDQEQTNGSIKTIAHPSVAMLDKATSQMTKLLKEMHFFDIEESGEEFDI